MASTGRVAQACARCRRQKLKCDPLRPCTLCVRAGVDCEPRRASQRRPSDRLSTARRERAVHHAPVLYSPKPPASTAGLPSFSTTAASPGAHLPSARNPPHQSPPGDAQEASDQSPNENQQFGANSSVIDFARNVFRHNDLASPSITSTIPGDPGVFKRPISSWGLQSMMLPPASVMYLLLEAYFDRVHWFIFLFHQPSFLARAKVLLSSSPWTRRDLPGVMTILMTSAMALKCVLNDTSWTGHSVLASYAMDARSLLSNFISEIRVHLLDLLDDSQVETVQVCILLGTYYIYHGSPSLAWSILGMASRTAYALALHCEDPADAEPVATQVRHRSWNHVTVADTFSAMIYGRPAGLDAAFAQLQPLSEMDDTVVETSVAHHLESGSITSELSNLTFHVLKYQLYSITRQALSTFRLLRLKEPLSVEDQDALIRAVSQIESLLVEWERQVPPYLSGSVWQDVDPAGPFPPELQCLSRVKEDAARTFLLQAIVLQITYDSTIILIHRPLLEHKMSSQDQGSGSGLIPKFVSRSLEVAVDAALRISRISMLQQNHQLSLSFAFMHFFTAGIILCIPPARQPFSSVAQEAKAGIMRIILTCRGLGSSSQIAQHIDQLLTALLRVTVLREMDNALQNQSAAPSLSELSATPFERDDRTEETRPSEVDRSATYSLNQFPTSTHQATNATSLPPQLPGQGDQQFSFDLSSFQDHAGIEFDTQLDEAFGSFGQGSDH